MILQNHMISLNQMKHYICTGGCEGVSGKPGTCGAKTCPKHGKPLTECDCGDGKHNTKTKSE
ncbi:MAG: hypothetical protein AAB899_05175 [Patescibacteria group bacterium]